MKSSRFLWLIPVAIVLFSLIIGGSIALGSGTDEDAELEPFYGVSPELTTELEQIVLANSEVQSLLDGTNHSFTINGRTIEDQDFYLAVGVRLKEGITPEEFREWVKSGRHDSSLIEEYVGVLNIGYNDRYYLTLSREKGQVTEIQYDEGYRRIPEVTQEEKQRAVEIALADTTVQQLLEGKNYEIAPDGKIGVWHDGKIKLGVVFVIEFDKPYSIDCELPLYNKDKATFHFADEATSLKVNVLFAENRVAKLVALSSTIED
jgi:hypothetical protein